MSDFSELADLEADLRSVGPKAARYVAKAVEVTARHVKDDWRDAAERTGLYPYSSDIDYDMEIGGGVIAAEVGPTPGDAGSLGIVEDAPGGVRSRPQHAGRSALRANEDDFERGVLLAALDAWEKP